jgi:hypothetical protein
VKTLNNMTHEALIEEARKRSVGGWAAIVEIHRYMASEAFTTIASSSIGPIKSRSRGGEFVGVGAQFRNGESMNRPAPKNITVAPVDSDDDELPF